MMEVIKRVVGLKEKARLTDVFNKETAKVCSNPMQSQ
ncbi:hypothetical protein FHR33_009869 [Nonomuraea dietziae]|uniref:Uncharacterized protein n=1 Tax=Nonomuraea dietziae TaxID=65515 RepID=A0A7W5VFF6_9ACTN|nr:hypothetical protein [Nonomuraea dietziae]